MPVSEHYIPHGEDMGALLCALVGKDPERYGTAGWIVLLIQGDEAGLDVSMSTDAPSTEFLIAALSRIVLELERSRQ